MHTHSFSSQGLALIRITGRLDPARSTPDAQLSIQLDPANFEPIRVDGPLNDEMTDLRIENGGRAFRSHSRYRSSSWQ